MLSMLQNWEGKVEVNGIMYNSIHDISLDTVQNMPLNIKLFPVVLTGLKKDGNPVTTADNTQEYRITVKKYMTEPSSPQFDFMAKWNNNNPMPLRTMTGTVVKETRGMMYMKLHGVGEPVIKCLRCGRTLTNPISRHYGIGPECLGKLGFSCGIEDITTIKDGMVDITWEGWIIKSAITEQTEVE